MMPIILFVDFDLVVSDSPLARDIAHHIAPLFGESAACYAQPSRMSYQ
jgi:hypothetical protein